MPELPEVETVRRGLAPAMAGARFVRVEVRRGDLRWPLARDFRQRLEGHWVAGLGRRAKYLLADLSSGEVLLMHLGMSGSFHVGAENVGAEHVGAENTSCGASACGKSKRISTYHHARAQHLAHDHVVFHMSSGAIVTFNDPRRFGSMKIVPPGGLAAEPLLRGLGPEPLGNAFDAATLARACNGKKTSLKAALLDQRVVAGLGNIYVCEALHRALLSPRRRAASLALRSGAPSARAERLVAGVRDVLDAAIAAGGSSLRDHKRTDGALGLFQHHFRVYDREGEGCPTPRCGGTVRRIVQGGRSTFYCPACQK